MDEVQLSQEYGSTMRRTLLFTNNFPPGTYFIKLGRMMGPLSGFERGIPGL